MSEEAKQGLLVAGRYRLDTKIGSGAMGAVWVARDETLGRVVVIKEITFPSGLGATGREQMRKRMAREAQLASMLHHPAIVTVHDFMEWDGRPWIVMTRLTGVSLQDRIDQDGRLTPVETASIGLVLVDALNAAHKAGIVHRDIKPSNIMMTDEGPVIVDFGIARQTDGLATQLTYDGQIIGTPAYMAPETLRAGGVATPAADLWSLGATLYTMIEGRGPYPGRTSVEALLVALLHEPPEPAAHAGPMAGVLAGLLGKDPARRMTGDEAKRHLQAVVEGHPLPWRPADTLPPPGPPQSGPPSAGPPPAGPPGQHATLATDLHGTRKRTVQIIGALVATVLLATVLVAGTVTWRSLQEAQDRRANASATSGSRPTSTPYTLTPVAGGYRYRDARFSALVPSTWRVTDQFYDYAIIRFDIGDGLWVDIGRVDAAGDVVSIAHASSQSGRAGYRETAPPRPIDGLPDAKSWSYSYTGSSGQTVWAETVAKPVEGGYFSATLSTGGGAAGLATGRAAYHKFIASLSP